MAKVENPGNLPDVVRADMMLDTFIGTMEEIMHTELNLPNNGYHSVVKREHKSLGRDSESFLRILSISPDRVVRREEFKALQNSRHTVFSHVIAVWDDVSGRLISFSLRGLELKARELFNTGTIDEVEGSLERLQQLVSVSPPEDQTYAVTATSK